MRTIAAADRTPALKRVYPPRTITRHLINPLMRAIVGTGLASERFLVLRFIGRRSGRPYAVPVICHALDDALVVFTTKPWSANFNAPRSVEVVRRGRRTTMRAERQREPAAVANAYHCLLADSPVKTAQRRFNIRIQGDHIPPLADLVDSCRSGGISMVVLIADSA